MTSGNINFSGGSNIGPMIGANAGEVNTYNTIYQMTPPQPPDPNALADAQRTLAALPLDTIPDPAAPPALSRMTLSRNPLFVGREDALKQLARALKAGKTAAIGQVVAATGMGGIGKTQLACEFVYRYGQFFAGGVFWLSFAEAAAVPAEIAACGGGDCLDLRPDWSNLALDAQIAAVAGAWKNELPRLLVFDNCEDEALLEQWRPRIGGCRVLVTSRKASWPPTLNVRALPLGELKHLQSVALLCKYRDDLPTTNADLHLIAAELGNLPLALHLSGSYLKRFARTVTPAAYLQQLRAPNPLAIRALEGYRMDQQLNPTQHEEHVANTFALSYRRLNPSDTIDALALKLLARAAHFAPGEPLPHWLLLLTAGVMLNEQSPDYDLDAVTDADEALTRLTDLGLLEAEAAGALRMHRLVALFVRSVARDAEAQDAVERAMIDVAFDLNTAGDPRPLLELQTHLRHVTDAAEQRGDEQAATLCNSLGYHLQMIGDSAGAKPYYERALAIREQVQGAKHPDTATSLNNLGALHAYEGNFQDAIPLMRRALAIREKVLGSNHPDTQSSRQSLANIEQAATPVQTVEQQIAEIEQRAEAAVERVLAEGDAEQWSALAERIGAAATAYAGGQAEGSPYLALAERLRALAARLRRGES